MNKECIAIIPARGGSKRIPGKNIKNFLGKPIINYSIDAALKSNLFNEIMVTTDDNEISDISIKAGASVPFFRSKENSNDSAGISEVLIEVIKSYMELGIYFKYLCCILPTAIFIKPERIIEGINILKNNNFDSVFPIVKFSYPILRALKIENNKVNMIWPENYHKRSQDLIKAYHDCGQFYWINVKVFLEKKIVFTDNSGYIELNESEVQDIDTLEDWKIAELKYKILNN